MGTELLDDMNVDRLLRVRDGFLAAPTLLEMEDFASPIYAGGEICGTAMCIGGAGALDAGFLTLRLTPREGTERVMYDITPDGRLHFGQHGVLDMFRAAYRINSVQSDRLFYTSSWPKGFQTQFLSAKDAASRARVAGRRIDQFISTRGRE